MMTTDYCKLNQFVTVTATAIPDVVSLSRLTHLLALGTQLLTWQMSSPYLSIKPTRGNSVSAGKASNTPSLSYIRIVLTLALCHNLVFMGLDHCSLPQGITLVHSIDDIMPTRSTEQEIEATLDFIC